MVYFAHTVDGGLEKGQPLAEHLMNVAKGAELRASSSVPRLPWMAACAEAAGLLHDVGKYRDGFIAHLRGVPVPDTKRHHKQAGAAWAATFGLGPVVTAILGHHGGMPDYYEIEDILDGEAGRAALGVITGRAIADCQRLTQIDRDLARSVPALEPLDEDLFTRIVFSCLVDADWEDTSAHERNAKGLPPEPVPPRLEPGTRLPQVLEFIGGEAAKSTQPAVSKREG